MHITDTCCTIVAINLLITDPFDDPKPINRRLRTQSAPATVRLMRLKSARVYKQPPGGRRVVSAMPRTMESALPPITRELAVGP